MNPDYCHKCGQEKVRHDDRMCSDKVNKVLLFPAQAQPRFRAIPGPNGQWIVYDRKTGYQRSWIAGEYAREIAEAEVEKLNEEEKAQ